MSLLVNMAMCWDSDLLMRWDDPAELLADDHASRDWGHEPTAETLIELIACGIEGDDEFAGHAVVVAVMQALLGVSSDTITSGGQGWSFRPAQRFRAADLHARMSGVEMTSYLERIWADVHAATGMPPKPEVSGRLANVRKNRSLAASIAAGLEQIAGPPDPAVLARRMEDADALISNGVIESIGHEGLAAAGFGPGEHQSVLEHLAVWLEAESASVTFGYAAEHAKNLTVEISTVRACDLLGDRRVHEVLVREFYKTVELLDGETPLRGIRAPPELSAWQLSRHLLPQVGWCAYSPTLRTAGTIGKAIALNMAAYGVWVDGIEHDERDTRSLDEHVHGLIMPRPVAGACPCAWPRGKGPWSRAELVQAAVATCRRRCAATRARQPEDLGPDRAHGAADDRGDAFRGLVRRSEPVEFVEPAHASDEQPTPQYMLL